MTILGCCLKKPQSTKQLVLSPGISPLFRVAKLHCAVSVAQVLFLLYKSPCRWQSRDDVMPPHLWTWPAVLRKMKGRNWAGVWDMGQALIHSFLFSEIAEWKVRWLWHVKLLGQSLSGLQSGNVSQAHPPVHLGTPEGLDAITNKSLLDAAVAHFFFTVWVH